MNKIINDTKYRVFNISPNEVKYCIYPSKFCDYTQFGLTKIHPHAGLNRGVFREDPNGYIRICKSNWDRLRGVLFSDLLEYKALRNHYNGKENWKKSKFAERNVEYIKKKNQVRGFTNYKNFLLNREKQIDKLLESIIKKGVYPIGLNTKDKDLFIDNISLALNRKKKFFFNNRGHHRLSIAKILNLKKIPIKITISKSKKILKEFIASYEKKN